MVTSPLSPVTERGGERGSSDDRSLDLEVVLVGSELHQHREAFALAWRSIVVHTLQQRLPLRRGDTATEESRPDSEDDRFARSLCRLEVGRGREAARGGHSSAWDTRHDPSQAPAWEAGDPEASWEAIPPPNLSEWLPRP